METIETMETLTDRDTEISGILSECGLGACPKSANPRPGAVLERQEQTGSRAGETIKKNAVPILLGVIAVELLYIAWRVSK